jgi:hypothetical protein
MTITKMSKLRALFADGWLVVATYFVVFSWSRWVSLGGFALFYERRSPPDSGYEVKGRTWLQDFVHLGWTAAAAAVLFRLGPQWSRPALLFVFALASFRVVDLFFDCTMLAVFGNRYGRPWQGAMPPRRLHRTLIIDFLLFSELVLWNASWVWIASMIRPSLYAATIDNLGHALHFSVATVTTIGYGTYAPVETASVLAALLQALSTLLLLSGVIAGVFSRSTSISPEHPVPVRQKSPSSTDAYGLAVVWDDGWGWRLRWVLPVVLPTAAVLYASRLFMQTDWLPR